jgi:hypothetical protein
MKHCRAAASVLAILTCLATDTAKGACAVAQGPDAVQKEAMRMRVRGEFDVKLAPLPTDLTAEGPGLGRMSIDKRFHGDLEGTSKGEMLAARTEVKDSAGYVAIERVSGSLNGRKGTFVLQHSGTMTRGAQSLTVTVVPDSATGELTGLAGRMAIEITGGKHFYDFEYTLPDRP